MLWDLFKRHYGKDGDPSILVAHGTSRTLNPSLPQRVVDRALEKDRARAAAEYLAEFRTDVEGFVLLEVVESCVGDYREMLPASGSFYRAFVDPSGGSADSSHARRRPQGGTSDKRIVIDAVRERRPPFSPEDVVEEFATLLETYRVSSVTGDRYAGEFPRELFRKHGVNYELSEQTKCDLFRDLLPRLNSVSILLPRHDRLISQLVSFERTVSRGGRTPFRIRLAGTTDVANAVAGRGRARRQIRRLQSRIA